jgi:prepilin-type processing-associated H-X9-DG protein
LTENLDACVVKPPHRRGGITVIELLCAVAIVVIVLALALPAIMLARESSRRTACQSNLRQIGLAIQQYEQIHNLLPPGRDAIAGRDHSWVTLVLPQLELSRLYERYNFEQAWNDKAASENGAIAETKLPLFLCPSTIHKVAGASDYGGNYGSSLSGLGKGFGLDLAWDSGTLLALHTPSRTEPRNDAIGTGQITDGLNQTFLVMEDSGRNADEGGQWANGQQCFAHEYPTINEYRKQGIFSDHPSGANILSADGHVRLLSVDTDPWVIGALATRANGEVPESPPQPAG